MHCAQDDSFAVAEIPAALRTGFVKEFQCLWTGNFSVIGLAPPCFQDLVNELDPLVLVLIAKHLRRQAAQVSGAYERSARLSQSLQKLSDFPDLVQGWHGAASRKPANRRGFPFRQRPDLCQIAARARKHGNARPLRDSPFSKSADFAQNGVCLSGGIPDANHLHPAQAERIILPEFTARKEHLPVSVDADGVIGLRSNSRGSVCRIPSRARNSSAKSAAA